jgi:hypothetical protein
MTPTKVDIVTRKAPATEHCWVARNTAAHARVVWNLLVVLLAAIALTSLLEANVCQYERRCVRFFLWANRRAG